MITPEEFPYITGLHVNDCYTYKDFDINLNNYKPFSHLILTGKNGSGKSSILKSLKDLFFNIRERNKFYYLISIRDRVFSINRIAWKAILADSSKTDKEIYELYLSMGPSSMGSSFQFFDQLNQVHPTFDIDPGLLAYPEKLSFVFTFLETRIIDQVKKVLVPTKESDFTEKINLPESTKFFSDEFNQYLVNKKVEQAFHQIQKKNSDVDAIDSFFNTLRTFLSDISENSITDLYFEYDQYRFIVVFKDGRKVLLDSLPSGFSALFSTLMDLFIRIDLIRKQIGNNTYNPCGIVLIDEPETHLHLELQEQVLPLFTELFPNIQFIVATHSPAVIASIKSATIFDLTTKETRTSEETVGRSYSELMTAHFGLENTYSSIADGIIDQINDNVAKYKDDVDGLKSALAKIYSENNVYLSPTLQVELELLIAQAEAKQAVVR